MLSKAKGTPKQQPFYALNGPNFAMSSTEKMASAFNYLDN